LKDFPSFLVKTPTNSAGFLAYHKLDEALRLNSLAGSVLTDSRVRKNSWNGLDGQSVYGHLGNDYRL
jgi:hypothetical protein